MAIRERAKRGGGLKECAALVSEIARGIRTGGNGGLDFREELREFGWLAIQMRRGSRNRRVYGFRVLDSGPDSKEAADSNNTAAGVCSTSAYSSAGGECQRFMLTSLPDSYLTVSASGAEVVMAVTPLLDCAVTFTL